MLREAEIWEAQVFLTECPHCEARMVVDLQPQPDLTIKLICDTCDKEFVGLFDVERHHDV